MSYSVAAFGTYAADKALEPMTIERRICGANDVRMNVLFCGVCHTDVHHARSDRIPAPYPCVPGHEMVGRIVEVGADVTKFKVGELAGVGCMVDACKNCESCNDDEEQFCLNGRTSTYGSPEKTIGGHTKGGYSKEHVCRSEFACKIPAALESNLAAVAPLLCAGITTYSPLVLHNIGPGSKVGIVGLGGLGHMGLKIAAAMGAEVTLITTSANKVDDAKRLGASKVIISTDPEQIKAAAGTLNFIIDTVSANHSYSDLLLMLKRGGKLCVVSSVTGAEPIPTSKLMMGRKSIVGSLIGGIKETEEMLEFCAKHNLFSDIELIDMNYVNEAWERMLKSDVKFRFVIDVQNSQF